MSTPASMIDELRRMRDGGASPPSPSAPSAGGDSPVRRKVFARADQLGVPRTLADRLIAKESSWSHTDGSGKVKRGPVTRSGERAVGLMQVMPSTGVSMGFKNLDDEDENITAGLTYIKRGLDTHGGDEGLAALYYFGGPGAAAQAARTGKAPNIDDGNGGRKGTSAADYMSSVGGSGNAARKSPSNINPMIAELRRMRDGEGNSAALSPVEAQPATQVMPAPLPTPTPPSPSTSMLDELRQMRDATSQGSPLPVVNNDPSSSLTRPRRVTPLAEVVPGAIPTSQPAEDVRVMLPGSAPQRMTPQVAPIRRAASAAAATHLDDDVLEFATRIDGSIPVDEQYTGDRPNAPLTLDDYTAKEKSWTERAAISAASIGQNTSPMRGDDPLKQAQTVRLDARKGEVPSPEAVNRAYVRSLGSGYESIYDDYQSKTGRSLLALDETPAELIRRARYVTDANSPTGGYYEASIATTERTVGLLNAYAQGGIEGARNFAAQAAGQESQPEAAPSPAEVSPTLDAARRGFAEGSIGAAQLVQNIELLGRGLKAELTGGVQGEDYKSLH